jgi:hypothetical protein
MYYRFGNKLEQRGNTTILIGKNKQQMQKIPKNHENYVREEGVVGEIEEMDVDWVSVNSEYEPVQVEGVGEGRTFYYYITKAKEAHTFISTSKAELKDEVEKMKEAPDVEVIQDLSKVEGKAVAVETEYSPNFR